MAVNCKVPTPKKYVEFLLDYSGYVGNVYGKRILENSCGTGNVLVEIVERYIKSSLENNISKSRIVKGLERDVEAYEIDSLSVSICIERLNLVLNKYNLKNVKWSIFNTDYLAEDKHKYDYVIGNPPYINYHDISLEQREFLKSKFVSCSRGMFDYCYAFIEKGMYDLDEDGILTYIVPYSILKNKFGKNLRELILPYVNKIYDFKGIKVFPNITASAVIIVLNKHQTDSLFYNSVSDNVSLVLSKNNLNEKWEFEEKKEGVHRFGDCFAVNNSIATLCNDAFLIKKYTKNNKYYIVDNGEIEKELVYNAISTKSFKFYPGGIKIIFPYKVTKNGVKRFNEMELKTKYPKAYKYLLTQKTKLLRRKSSMNCAWFEYGRSQAVAYTLEKKIIMPMIISKNTKIYIGNEGDVPYAGYLIRAISERMSLNIAKKILESSDFYDYAKICGTPTSANSYRVSVRDICDYRFNCIK